MSNAELIIEQIVIPDQPWILVLPAITTQETLDALWDWFDHNDVVRPLVIAVDDVAKVSALDEDTMRRLGWVRSQ